MTAPASALALPPGSTIGILGGGQLGRMLAGAAAKLGLHTHIYAPDAESPAAAVSAAWTRANFDDEAALRRFAAAVDVVTYEFENVPAECARVLLASGVPVRPGAAALEASQDRVIEKEFLNQSGVATTAFAPITKLDDIAPALTRLGLPSVLKTRRFGYDGKGQVWIRSADQAEAAWKAIGRAPAILEAAAPFVMEVSIIAARGLDGAVRFYDLAHNRHENGILQESVAPALVDDAVVEAAQSAAEALLDRLDYVGVLAIEFFLMPDGRLLANEIAPRVHNSGHWTADACACGQFEQHIRAIAGWPLGDSRLPRKVTVRMSNLVGDAALDWPAIAADPRARLTLYGKRETRPGRKMGHVTRIKSANAESLE